MTLPEVESDIAQLPGETPAAPQPSAVLIGGLLQEARRPPSM